MNNEQGMKAEVKTQPDADQPDNSKLSKTDSDAVSSHLIGRLCKYYAISFRMF